MRKVALSVGINNYTGWVNDLEQCVNDMNNVNERLALCGYEAYCIQDQNATYQSVKQMLESCIAELAPGDWFVFSYSGHGSYQLDVSGDEIDGFDEVICLHDRDMPDDDLRQILSKIPQGVLAAIIMDCCFSGTNSRVMVRGTVRNVRFRPPLEPIPFFVKKKKAFLTEETMNHVLLAACTDEQYSYEDDEGGAFTNALLKVLDRPLDSPISFEQFAVEIKKHLPTDDFPQDPQVEGSSENRQKLMPFFYHEVEQPDEPPGDEPDQPPAPDEPGSGIGCLPAVAGFFGVLLLIIYIVYFGG